jgi:hypothetical protein
MPLQGTAYYDFFGNAAPPPIPRLADRGGATPVHLLQINLPFVTAGSGMAWAVPTNEAPRPIKARLLNPDIGGNWVPGGVTGLPFEGFAAWARQTNDPLRPLAKVLPSGASHLIAPPVFVQGDPFPGGPQTITNIGPTIAGTGSNDTSIGDLPWSNPSRITADDGSSATINISSNVVSNWLIGNNFGFAIPATATIRGILVEWKRFNSNPVGNDTLADFAVRVIKGGVIGSEDRSAASNWQQVALAYQSYGGLSDLWGLGWNASDINSATFGVALAVIGTQFGGSAAVDAVRVTISYLTGGLPMGAQYMVSSEMAPRRFVPTIAGGSTYNLAEPSLYTPTPGISWYRQQPEAIPVKRLPPGTGGMSFTIFPDLVQAGFPRWSIQLPDPLPLPRRAYPPQNPSEAPPQAIASITVDKWFVRINDPLRPLAKYAQTQTVLPLAPFQIDQAIGWLTPSPAPLPVRRFVPLDATVAPLITDSQRFTMTWLVQANVPNPPIQRLAQSLTVRPLEPTQLPAQSFGWLRQPSEPLPIRPRMIDASQNTGWLGASFIVVAPPSAIGGPYFVIAGGVFVAGMITVGIETA